MNIFGLHGCSTVTLWIILLRLYSRRSTWTHIWDACFVTNVIEPHLTLNRSVPRKSPGRGWLLLPLKCSQCAFLRIKTNIESSGSQFVQIKPVFWPIICAPAAVQRRCSETVWQHINMQRIIQPRRTHTVKRISLNQNGRLFNRRAIMAGSLLFHLHIRTETLQTCGRDECKPCGSRSTYRCTVVYRLIQR